MLLVGEEMVEEVVQLVVPVAEERVAPLVDDEVVGELGELGVLVVEERVVLPVNAEVVGEVEQLVVPPLRKSASRFLWTTKWSTTSESS